MTLAKLDRKAGWLRIYNPDNFEGDKGTLSEGVVFCPFQGTEIHVNECRTCEFCDGVALDPTGRNSFLMCARPIAEAPEEFKAPKALERDHPEEAGPELFKTPIRDIMTNLVVTVSPELSLESLTDLFVDRGISGAPVIDDDRKAIGVVTKTDILRALQENEGFEEGNANVAELTVHDVMTPISMSLPEHATIGRAAALMSYEGIHRLPVLDNHERVIGLLSSVDVLRWIAKTDGYRVPGYTQQQHKAE